MEFSECFKVSQRLCKFSPSGEYLANCVQYKLVVRRTPSLDVKSVHTCLDAVSAIEWSRDSMYLLCILGKRGIVQVWSMEDPEWTCKIAQGSCGLASARWSPDSRHILTTAEFQLRITIWSLVNKSASYIKFPKHSNRGLDFTVDGHRMALAERHNCKDHISIFTCSGWGLLQHFETKTNDLSDLAWSPDGRTLAVWDSSLEYKMLIYGVDGQLLTTFSAYDFALGIKSVAWSPSGMLLSVGSYDQSVRLLNALTWRQIVEHKHASPITSSFAVVYKEIEEQPVMLPWDAKPSAAFSLPSHYEVQQPPFQLPSINPDAEKPNPKLGVGCVEFSCDTKYLATRNDNMPNVLWIWDVNNVRLAVVLVQAHPIRAVRWDPRQCRLALSTGTNKLYVWSPAGCLAVQVPVDAAICISSLEWHPRGSAVALVGKDQWCVCSLPGPVIE